MAFLVSIFGSIAIGILSGICGNMTPSLPPGLDGHMPWPVSPPIGGAPPETPSIVIPLPLFSLRCSLRSLRCGWRTFRDTHANATRRPWRFGPRAGFPGIGSASSSRTPSSRSWRFWCWSACRTSPSPTCSGELFATWLIKLSKPWAGCWVGASPVRLKDGSPGTGRTRRSSLSGCSTARPSATISACQITRPSPGGPGEESAKPSSAGRSRR